MSNTYKITSFAILGETKIVIEHGQSSIPPDIDNRDYQQFLVDWEAGATVLSSTGVPLPWGSEPS